MEFLCLRVDGLRCVQIYARDPKEVPDWMKANWQHAVPVDKLKVSN